MTPKSTTKPAKIIFSLIWWTLTVALIVLLVTIFSAKLQGKVPKLFGHSVMRIVTGSMEPELMVDDYILIRGCDPEDIKKGDIISFYSTDPAIYGMPNTHRVAEDPIITENGVEFVTRGDANASEDAYRVTEEMLIGKCVGKLGALNAVSSMMSGSSVFIIFFILQGAIIAIFVISLFRKDCEEKPEGEKPYEISEDEEERLKAEAIAEYLASKEKENKSK